MQLETLSRYRAMASFSETPIHRPSPVPTSRGNRRSGGLLLPKVKSACFEYHLNGLVTICTHNQSMKQKSLPVFHREHRLNSLARTCPCLSSRQADQEAFLEEVALLPPQASCLPLWTAPSQPLCRPISLRLPLPQRCCSASG